jgi:hypothetical protein
MRVYISVCVYIVFLKKDSQSHEVAQNCQKLRLVDLLIRVMRQLVRGAYVQPLNACTAACMHACMARDSCSAEKWRALLGFERVQYVALDLGQSLVIDHWQQVLTLIRHSY